VRSLRDSQHRTAIELDACRAAWESAQNPGAVFEALRLCEQGQAALPRWLYRALETMLITGLRGDRDPKGRRLEQLWRRHGQDVIDYVRYDIIADARAPAPDGRPRMSWPRATAYACERLHGTEASGHPETLRASYKKVRRLLRTTPQRYFFGHADHVTIARFTLRPTGDSAWTRDFARVRALAFLRECLPEEPTSSEVMREARALRVAPEILAYARRRLRVRVRAGRWTLPPNQTG
jgi:hypothetical protein